METIVKSEKEYKLGDSVTQKNIISFAITSFAISRNKMDAQILFVDWFIKSKASQNLGENPADKVLSMYEKAMDNEHKNESVAQIMEAFNKVQAHNTGPSGKDYVLSNFTKDFEQAVTTVKESRYADNVLWFNLGVDSINVYNMSSREFINAISPLFTK